MTHFRNDLSVLGGAFHCSLTSFADISKLMKKTDWSKTLHSQ